MELKTFFDRISQAVMDFIAQYGGTAKKVLAGAICVLVFIMLYFYAAAAIKDRYEYFTRLLRGSVSKAMRNTKWDLFNYYYLQKFLDSVGITYYSRGKITPLTYITYKIGCMVVGLLIGISVNLAVGLVFAIAAWFLPDIYFREKNKEQNRNMMRDIMDIYDIILLQTGAGTHITLTLVDAYMVVENPRLKSALLELTGKLRETNDVLVSLNVFNSRFDNEHIANLSAAIMQSVESGNSVQMLADIKKYATNLQDSYNEQERLRIERRCRTYIVCLCAGLIGMLLCLGTSGALDAATGLGFGL